MKRIFRLLAPLLALALLAPGALCEGLSFTGSVTAARSVNVYAPIGGTVEQLNVEPGQSVTAGSAIATLSTDKVYATEAGTITGIFGQSGDNAETVAARYGAVMYIEGEHVYTIAASTQSAYNATENMFVHVGERVYLNCYSDSAHTGWGVITAIEGTDFTVEVTEGEFLLGETVSVYRGSAAKSAMRIGRGTLKRINPVAVSAQGSIVSIAVTDGQRVERGDLLFETLSGDFDGLFMSGTTISAPEDGVVAQLNVQAGGELQKGGVAAVLYPADALRIEAQVSEGDLGLIAEGDPVNIELIWNQDEDVRYSGTISRISALSSETESAGGEAETDTTYTVYIDFDPDANTRYGMTAVITTIDTEAEARTDDAEDAQPPEERNLDQPADFPTETRTDDARDAQPPEEHSFERPADFPTETQTDDASLK